MNQEQQHWQIYYYRSNFFQILYVYCAKDLDGSGITCIEYSKGLLL